MTTIDERVAAGAAWLDEQRPGWESAIVVGKLAMNRCDRCILGQIYGSYWGAPGAKNIDENQWTTFAVAHGFESAAAISDSANLAADYASLAAAWIRLLDSRRNRAEGAVTP